MSDDGNYDNNDDPRWAVECYKGEDKFHRKNNIWTDEYYGKDIFHRKNDRWTDEYYGKDIFHRKNNIWTDEYYGKNIFHRKNDRWTDEYYGKTSNYDQCKFDHRGRIHTMHRIRNNGKR
jgi:hypothetical protein